MVTLYSGRTIYQGSLGPVPLAIFSKTAIITTIVKPNLRFGLTNRELGFEGIFIFFNVNDTMLITQLCLQI